MQISVTALFYLEDSRRIHPPSVRACQPKDLKWREWRSAWVRGRERESALAPPFICSPPPGPALCKLGLARSAVCSTWSLHSGPRTFFCSIFVSFSLPCLSATAILDSFSLFYVPNNLLQNGLVGSPCSPRDSQESSPTPQCKNINSSVLSLLHSPTLTSIHDYWRDRSWTKNSKQGRWSRGQRNLFLARTEDREEGP